MGNSLLSALVLLCVAVDASNRLPFFCALSSITSTPEGETFNVPVCREYNGLFLKAEILLIRDTWSTITGVYGHFNLWADASKTVLICSNNDGTSNWCQGQIPEANVGEVFLEFQRSIDVNTMSYQVNVALSGTPWPPSKSRGQKARRLNIEKDPIVLAQHFLYTDTVMNGGDPSFSTLFTCSGALFPQEYYVKAVVTGQSSSAVYRTFLCTSPEIETDCNARTKIDVAASESAINMVGFTKAIPRSTSHAYLAIYGDGPENTPSAFTVAVVIAGNPNVEPVVNATAAE